LTYPDGRTFTGNYSFNRRHGKGILTQKNGVALAGVWEGGLMVRAIQEIFTTVLGRALRTD